MNSTRSRIKDGALFTGLYTIDFVVRHFYDGQYENLTDAYLHDVMLPAQILFGSKALNALNGDKNTITAYSFLGCSAFEILQGIGLYPGYFDLKDILAYAAGTGIALGLDSIISKKKEENLEANTNR